MKRKSIHQEAKELEAAFQTRRHFLKTCGSGLGAMVLGSLVGCGQQKTAVSSSFVNASLDNPFAPKVPHYTPKAKRVIYLHMAGAPSQLELFEYKPELQKLDGQLCPESLIEGKKFAFIKGRPLMLGSQYNFAQHGASGAYVSDRLPYFANMVDEVTFLRAMHTDQFNHAPAQLFLYTGSPRLGRPSMGSWVTYGLGSENEDLPAYIVLVSGGSTPSAGKSVWGSGFLPSIFQGVQCRSEGDPILYVSDPDGMTRELRAESIETIKNINEQTYAEVQDPEILTRISQYEMAYRMQVSVPEVMDIADEPAYIHEMYGTTPGEGSFANNCLLARRLAEKGVRFIQLFDWGWDAHGAVENEALNGGFVKKCKQIDKPLTALLADLKQRGMLEDTLVVWGGEFGRTPMREARFGLESPLIGRDHHSDAFTIWMAGGGIKQGFSFGETDEIGYNGIKDRTGIHDLQATILHLLGIDHEKLTYHFQGRPFRLTDVAGEVIHQIIA